jgi:hypothetical protein
MKLKDKGWLKDYLVLRRGLVKDVATEDGYKASHPEHALYRILQPTGLMYGQSFGELNIPEAENLDRKNRLRILLAESFISSALLSHNKTCKSGEDVSGVILRTLESIGNFYNNIFPELAIPTKTILGRKKSSIDLAEKILDKRIEHANKFQENFWSYFFHNSLLFLDIFIYGQWIHTNSDRIIIDFFRFERDELRFSVVKVITAAAHANKEVAPEERKLYELFIESTDLSSERRKETLRIFEGGLAIEDIVLPSENSWILRKFFLEIAILTIWADKKVEQAELEFLKRFCHYLGFSEEDLETSMIGIEGFVLEQWEHLDYLKDAQDYRYVSEQYIKRLTNAAEKNMSRLIKNMSQNPEILALSKKARSMDLTSQEKDRVRIGLLQLLRNIPAFGIVSLPEKFLTLPMLLKVIPSALFAEGIKR